LSPPPIRKIKCSRACGWHRAYTDSREWKDTIIDHPLYGKVRNEVAVERDVWDHNCAWATAATVKAYELFGDSNRAGYGS
jgi:hypothetical protein